MIISRKSHSKMELEKLTNEAISLLKRLIETPSFSSEEDQTAVLIENWFKQFKIPFQRTKNNVWSNNKYFDETKPTLLLNSHHETVKPNSAFTKNPFEAKSNNRKRYFMIMLTLMLVLTPVIIIFGSGRDTFFMEPNSPLNEYDANSTLFNNLVFLYRSFEIVIISNALYLSYIGIWKRNGLNKRVK